MNDRVVLHAGDCLTVLAGLPECSVDAVVCDPPYGLEFMGKEWDAPWQVSSKSALFGKRERALPGWGVTRNPTCRNCAGRLRGAKKCSCDTPAWDEAPTDTRLRQMHGFQEWCEQWAKHVLRVLKPGGHLVAFSGTRTYHRMVVAIEDAGFEVRDQLAWVFGSGFPKSLDVSKAIDKAAGANREVVGRRNDGRYASPMAVSGRQAGIMGNVVERLAPEITAPATPAARQWEGWGTALKPAYEPIVLARKPLSEGTVAANVLRWGTGALNIDATRISSEESTKRPMGGKATNRTAYGTFAHDGAVKMIGGSDNGRWPANLAHDGSEEVLAGFPETKSGKMQPTHTSAERAVYGQNAQGGYVTMETYGDEGSAARFFYCAKANKTDRAGSKHPTVKPVALMRWLVRMVTPPGGTVLDPFAGTGTTGQAAIEEGFNAILIEREAEYRADIERRLQLVAAE